MKYTYRFVEPSSEPPFVKTIRYTRGTFSGWTPKMGIANVQYAIFRTRRTELLIPIYDLTDETKASIGLPSKGEIHCPNCNAVVWDTANVDQALNKCWGCGQRWLTDIGENEDSN